jgi:hypothetical protein
MTRHLAGIPAEMLTKLTPCGHRSEKNSISTAKECFADVVHLSHMAFSI